MNYKSQNNIEDKSHLISNLLKNYPFLYFFLLGIGAFIGIFVLKSPILATIAVFTLPAFFVLLRKPEIVILLLIILLSSIVYEEAIPKIPVVGGSLHVTDVFLSFLLFIIVFKLFTDSSFKLVKTPLNLPLLLFYFSVIISAFISLSYYKLDFHIVTGRFRALTYYLVFFCVTNLIRDKKQVNFLVKGLFAIASVVALTMLIQAIVGDSVKLMPGRVEKASALGQVFEATRIMPPGELLVYTFFITSGCVIAFNRKSKTLFISLSFYVFVILGIGVLLTYTRSYWVATILALSILLLIASGDNRKRLICLFIVVCVLGGSVSFMVRGDQGRFNKYLVALSKRFTSLFAGEKMIQSETLTWRYSESKYAIKAILKNPIFGIGIGNKYRPQLFGPEDRLMWYVHNGYLFILVKIGFVGLIFFLCFYGAFIVRCLLERRIIEDKMDMAIVTGFMISGVGILFIAVVMPPFMEWHNIMVISTTVGISEAIIRSNKEGLAT